MNIAFEIYRKAQSLGLRVEADGDSLLVWPKSKCPPELGEELKAHKRELLQWLTPPCPGWRTVPPPGLPLNALPPRPQPADAARVVDFISRQTDGADALCEWCLRRELAYWLAYHWRDDVCCYAAARDAACWQLKRDEAGVWQTLQGFAADAGKARTA